MRRIETCTSASTYPARTAAAVLPMLLDRKPFGENYRQAGLLKIHWFPNQICVPLDSDRSLPSPRVYNLD